MSSLYENLHQRNYPLYSIYMYIASHKPNSGNFHKYFGAQYRLTLGVAILLVIAESPYNDINFYHRLSSTETGYSKATPTYKPDNITERVRNINTHCLLK